MGECSSVVIFPVIARQPFGIDLAHQTQLVPLNDRARLLVLPVMRVERAQAAPESERAGHG